MALEQNWAGANLPTAFPGLSEAQFGTVAEDRLATAIVVKGSGTATVAFPLLDLVFGFEIVLALVVTLMAMNLAADRERLRAQGDFEMHVKLEEELRAVMTHLEVQDEVMLEIIQRLDHSDRELRRLTRRLGVEERTF